MLMHSGRGTGTSPAYWQAKNTVTKSGEGSATIATRSPSPALVVGVGAVISLDSLDIADPDTTNPVQPSRAAEAVELRVGYPAHHSRSVTDSCAPRDPTAKPRSSQRAFR